MEEKCDKQRRRALALISGGLDSLLAVKLVEEQGVEVLGLTFETPFFGSDQARRSATAIGLDLVVLDISDRHLEIVRNPRYGYGANMNPCIDCHGLMLRVAGEEMVRRGFDFLVTGDVLGQRSMSQRRDTLNAVDKLSGMKDLTLRPLSARLLPETMPEREGWVDRERFYAISGRSRKTQLELARRMGIEEYSTPSGGCLLTDPIFSCRLKELMEHEGLGRDDALLLRWGRHFRLQGGAKVAVGRNKGENQELECHALLGDLLLRVGSYASPTAVFRGSRQEGDVVTAARLVARYSDAPSEEVVEVKIWSPDSSHVETTLVRAAEEREVSGLRIGGGE
jgi:tRNA-specific 2-thiouridylase